MSPGLDLHELVLAGRDQREGREWLALRARADDHRCSGGSCVDLVDVDDRVEARPSGGRARGRPRRWRSSSGRRTRPCRPVASAISQTCWIRWRFEAKQATMIRLCAPGEDLPQRCRRRTDSDGVRPGVSAFVESDEHEVDALVAEPPEALEVGVPAVDRRLVDLEVARVEDAAVGCVDHDRRSRPGSSARRRRSGSLNGPSVERAGRAMISRGAP